MMFFLRHRLVSLAALTAYLVVNVGAAALHHHHHGAALPPGEVPTACGTELQYQPTGQTGEDDDEENCLLCGVLHLAQTLPGKVHVDVLIVPTGDAFSHVPIIQPHLLETPTRARSPPFA
jgi:hypothetical protein